MKRILHVFIGLLLLIALPSLAQSQVIKGTIADDKGPLQGVSVTIKGKPGGTTTDASGNFSIPASKGDVLLFSFTGYASQEVKVGDNPSLNILLITDAKALEGVVVVGYGSKKKQHLTGAVSTVSSKVFESRPIPNATAGLQGAVPGVTVQRGTGQPGNEGYEINVRGVSSTNAGNSPLVLIDGIVGSLDLLNPDDIESMSVLKDAAAAIYGARASGGVFLVTTKKGKRLSPRITYNGNVAVSKMTGMMKSPTNYEMAIMDNEANIHNGAVPMYTPDYLERIKNNDPNPVPHPLYGGWMLFFNNTDWLNEVMENGFQQKHNISISGGGNNSTYFLSGAYVDQRGVIKYANDNNKRYNLRLNYDFDFSKRLKLETKISMENQNRTDLGGLSTWVITEAIFGMPNHPVYSKDGKFFAQGGWGNAVAQAKEAATATYKRRNLNGNFKLIAEPIDGLKLNLQAAINHSSNNNEDIGKPIPLYNWDGDLVYYNIANPGQEWMSLYNDENNYRNYTAYAQYNKTFGKHELDLMAGASHEENNWDFFKASRDNFIGTDLWSLNLGGSGNIQNDGGGNHWAINSYFSRLGYVYNGKYMLEATVRYDGTSVFTPENRWGLFPGISAGWRLSQEDFIKDLKFFNDLKLRASYGETGNQETKFQGSETLYDFLQLIDIPRNTVYPFGAGSITQVARLGRMAATERTWERLATKNIGIDASMLSSRLNFSFDYFIKRNKNMLAPINYPGLLGATAPFTNSGDLKIWGFETSIGWKDRIGKLDYSASFILSDAQNKVMSYGGQNQFVPGLNTLKDWWNAHIREGDALDTYYGYSFDGLVRNQQQLDAYKNLEGVPSDIGIGDAMFKDLNGDGKITPEADLVNLGTIAPRFNYGINLGAKYSNFDFSVFFQGVGKRTLFREGDYSIPWTDWWRQPPAFYYGKTWNEDRPDAYYPRLTHGNIRWWNYQPSTLQEINGAYVRLKNLQVGYTLPANLMDRIHITSARIYFSGQDLWEKHHVQGGWDPESDRWGFNYPFQRAYSFGLDLTF